MPYPIVVDIHDDDETRNWVDTRVINALIFRNSRHRAECARLENTFRSERRLTFDILSILHKDAFVTFELFETALGVYLFAQAKVVDWCLFEPVDGFLKF